MYENCPENLVMPKIAHLTLIGSLSLAQSQQLLTSYHLICYLFDHLDDHLEKYLSFVTDL